MKGTFKRWKNLGEVTDPLVESFCVEFKKFSPLLEEIEKFAQENKVPILLPVSARLLYLFVKFLKPEKILEFGTGIGYSTLIMHHASPSSEIITVDSNKVRLNVAKEFFKEAKADIKIVEEDARSCISRFFKENLRFDFVFVDIQKAEYFTLIPSIYSILKEKFVVVFDNALFRGYVCGKNYDKRYERTVKLLKKFLDFSKKLPKVETFLIPVGDGFLVQFLS